MLDPADLPPDDILDYVAIDTDNTGQLRGQGREGKKTSACRPGISDPPARTPSGASGRL